MAQGHGDSVPGLVVLVVAWKGTAVVEGGRVGLAILSRGVRAWTQIKATSAEQRSLWRSVGQALRYGRQLHPSNQAFGAWCTEQGFGDMDRRVRADAMWLAENWHSLSNDWTTAASHPTVIRSEVKGTSDTPPSPDLALPVPSKLTAGIEVVAPIAKTVNKLAAMAERGEGQEAATARSADGGHFGNACQRVSDEHGRRVPPVGPLAPYGPAGGSRRRRRSVGG